MRTTEGSVKSVPVFDSSAQEWIFDLFFFVVQIKDCREQNINVAMRIQFSTTKGSAIECFLFSTVKRKNGF